VELEFPPIGFGPARLSCCGGFFPGPPELGAVNPMHDHVETRSRLRVDSLWIKSIVTSLSFFRSGLIHFVVCTSTLAQGVNLPIRCLIVTGVYQGGDRIPVRDFHNLIGRAGRAGMHTEGSVIFSDTKVFDKKRDRRDRWRWQTAKELLDFSNSEPSSSSISAIFDSFFYGQPTREVALDLEQLHNLVFDDENGVEAAVQQAMAANPGIESGRFRRFLQDRVRVVHGIASFLLAHLDFAGEGLAERAAELARNTLAHYLADDGQRAQIETLFRNIAGRLLEGAPNEDARAMLRRSPLAPTSVNRLRDRLLPLS
jgi:hypothetical protein